MHIQDTELFVYAIHDGVNFVASDSHILPMIDNNNNFSRNVTIVNELGLHARSAAKIAKIARQATARVWISKDTEKIDAASVIDILTLECTKGSRITLHIDDPSDLDILNTLEKLIKSGFGE